MSDPPWRGAAAAATTFHVDGDLQATTTFASLPKETRVEMPEIHQDIEP